MQSHLFSQETTLAQIALQPCDQSFRVLQNIPGSFLVKLSAQGIIGVLAPLAGQLVDRTVFGFDDAGFDEIFVKGRFNARVLAS
jgi:hypothetical protein